MKQLQRTVAMRLDYYGKRIHDLFGKPNPSFYAWLVAPPLVLFFGSGLFLVLSSGQTQINEVESSKSEQTAARELADSQARALEDRSASTAEEARLSIQQEYAKLLRENAELATRVSEMQKSAPVKAYMLYQQAQEEAAKAEKARQNAAVKQKAQAELEEKQLEACAMAEAGFEASKSTSSPEKLDKDFQALKNLCR